MNPSTARATERSTAHLQLLRSAPPGERDPLRHGSAELPAPPQAAEAWAQRSLDRIDDGLAVLDADGRVLFANRSARDLWAGSTVLREREGRLAARHPADDAALRSAAADAAERGLFRLLRLGPQDAPEFVALSPLDGEHDARRVLCRFERRGLCNPLALQGFASSFKLSSAESSVLQQLCDGADPPAIARRQGVALSTVRTQIAAIRDKTGAASVRELLRRLARLPAVGGRAWYRDCAA